MRIVSIVAAAALFFGGVSAAFAEGHSRSGTFGGASNHVTNGGVSVVKTDAGYEIHLGEDFFFDGAPDPRIALGNGGKFTKDTDFEVLHKDTGAQVYKIPASLNVDDFDTVVVWCRKFSVPLGQALLN